MNGQGCVHGWWVTVMSVKFQKTTRTTQTIHFQKYNSRNFFNKIYLDDSQSNR